MPEGRNVALRRVSVSLCAIIAFSIAMLGVPVSAEGVGVEVGDYWEYTFGGDFEGMSMDGKMKQKVVDETSSVFVIEQTGSADISGSVGGVTMDGELSIDGEMNRLIADFSAVENNFIMTISVSGNGISMDMSMGIFTEYDPALDDYIGDDTLSVGTTVTSDCAATMETWVEIMGMNESDTMTEDMTMTMEIVEANVSVETDAGTFNCYKVEVASTLGFESSSMFYYYSEKVGNYVKMEGDEDPILGLMNMELKAYSYGGEGTGAGILSGPTMWILLIVLVAAVVLIVLVLVMRGKKRAQMAPMMPPPQEMPPQPPPPTQ